MIACRFMNFYQFLPIQFLWVYMAVHLMAWVLASSLCLNRSKNMQDSWSLMVQFWTPSSISPTGFWPQKSIPVVCTLGLQNCNSWTFIGIFVGSKYDWGVNICTQTSLVVWWRSLSSVFYSIHYIGMVKDKGYKFWGQNNNFTGQTKESIKPYELVRQKAESLVCAYLRSWKHISNANLLCINRICINIWHPTWHKGCDNCPPSPPPPPPPVIHSHYYRALLSLWQTRHRSVPLSIRLGPINQCL